MDGPGDDGLRGCWKKRRVPYSVTGNGVQGKQVSLQFLFIMQVPVLPTVPRHRPLLSQQCTLLPISQTICTSNTWYQPLFY